MIQFPSKILHGNYITKNITATQVIMIFLSPVITIIIRTCKIFF